MVDLQSLKIERRAKTAAPKPRSRGNAWPLRLVVLAVLGGLAWLFAPKLLELSDRVRLPEVTTHVVTLSTPAAAAAVRGTAANGYVVAARRAALSSDVPGRIVEMAVREGSVVKRGDIVARLFADEYRAALARAAADLVTAETTVLRAEAAAKAAAADLTQAEASALAAAAQVDEARALVRFADLESERQRDLQGQNIGSQRDLDRAISERDAARSRAAAAVATAKAADLAREAAAERHRVGEAEVEVAKAQRTAAAAARDLAQATLDKTDVRAPFDGIVVLKDAEVGEVVSPNVQGGSNARGAVCTMVDFESLEVQANVPETSLGSVTVGAPADVFLDAFPDHRYAGKVDRIWPTADRQKATVEVRILLDRRDERLRPEMGVRIVFRTESRDGDSLAEPKPVLLIPTEAVITDAGRTGVFVIERDVATFTPVTLGERKNDRVVVTTGLQPDLRIVAAPPTTLRSGDRVRLRNP